MHCSGKRYSHKRFGETPVGGVLRGDELPAAVRPHGDTGVDPAVAPITPSSPFYYRRVRVEKRNVGV